jgi:hypothetical protein
VTHERDLYERALAHELAMLEKLCATPHADAAHEAWMTRQRERIAREAAQRYLN